MLTVNSDLELFKRADRFVLGVLSLSLIANITLGFLLHRTRRNASDMRPIISRGLSSSEMTELTQGSVPSIGRSDAPVAIVMFSDFQCPFCRRFASTLAQIGDKERNSVKIVFRQFPLSRHPEARQDAELATCAMRQSPQAFWDVYNYFYSRPNQNPATTLEATQFLQTRPGIQIDALHHCLDNHQSAVDVDHDLQLAKKFGVDATPTIFINGNRYIGFNGAPDTLNSIIDEQTRIKTSN